jgi:hypothetical protein
MAPGQCGHEQPGCQKGDGEMALKKTSFDLQPDLS